MPPTFPNHNFDQSADSGGLLWGVSSIVRHHLSQPIVDGTVLLGVEGPPVAVHPFGTDGPYLVVGLASMRC